MLSGIGPKADLEALGINVLLDRPAVGAYLQDRYEVAVISEMRDDFSILTDCRFRMPVEGEEDDPALKQWKQDHGGLVLHERSRRGDRPAIVREKLDPDLFIFGLPAAFKGYYPQYADALENAHNEFTWAILKAHNRNKGGVVKLASADPLERPQIDFHYFDEGTDTEGDDLRSVVEGVKFVREFTAQVGRCTQAPGQARTCSRFPTSRTTTRSPSGCATRPGATTPAAPAASVPKATTSARCSIRFQSAGNRGFARGRCLGFSQHSRLFHRDFNLHDRRESERGYPERCRPSATGRELIAQSLDCAPMAKDHRGRCTEMSQKRTS